MLRSRWLPVALACSALLALWPLWAEPVAALSDWPNHLARVHVLAHYESSFSYRACYAPAWGPYPNLGFDLIGVPLAKVLPTELVGRLFLTLVVVTWFAGVLLLGRAIEGRTSLRALVASLFLYSESFLLGYANYAFGMGLAMAALGLGFRAAPLTRGRRVLVASLALATAVSHAAAWVTLALGAFAFLVGRVIAAKRRGAPPVSRDTLGRALLFVPAGLYFAAWLLFIADHTRDRAFSGVRTSLRLLVGSTLPTYSENADVVILLWLAVVVLLTLATAARLRDLRRRVRPGPALAACLCLLAVFLAPADFAGSYEANGRYVLGAWTFALFAVRLRPIARARSLWGLLAATAIMVLFTRQVLVGAGLAQKSAELTAQARLFEALPPAAWHIGGVSFLDDRPSRAQFVRERALLHAPSLTVMQRQADVPMLYAIPGVQPLRYLGDRYSAHRIKQSDPTALDIARLKADLDAVMVCRAPPGALALLRAGGESLGVVGDCELVHWVERVDDLGGR